MNRSRWVNEIIANLRSLLFTGIAVWLPLIITFWVLHWLVTSVDGLQKHIPRNWISALQMGDGIPGFGILMVVLILLLTGFFARNFFGMKILALWEDFLHRIPIVKSIYRGVKQVSDNLFSGTSNAFRSAVLVEFPRIGTWTIGFVTSKQSPPWTDQPNDEAWLGIYVPTTPNPTSGYLIWAKASETKPVNMTVDEALKVVVSMGVLSRGGNATLPTKKPSLEKKG
jgi:uncharacterized membrane protein